MNNFRKFLIFLRQQKNTNLKMFTLAILGVLAAFIAIGVLTDIYYYLEKHKNDFSKENLEKIKSILKNSKNLVINENSKDSEIYKKLYEILEIKD